jgi:signal transduction histidine kinase
VRRYHQLETDFAATLEREKLESLRVFAYGASHEINNPLANIATRAQALLRNEKDPERKRKLSTIAAQAFRAHEMIADMMLFARPPSPEIKSFDVISLIREVIREVLPDAESQQTRLVFEPTLESFMLAADPTQIGVAVKALVRNALEAMITGGIVSVGVGNPPPDDMGTSWLDIVISDTGPGITPEVRRHLFDPFYSGREAGRGLGFGLAKCWRIAEMHSGEIRVESEPGGGATFRLRIPTSR